MRLLLRDHNEITATVRRGGQLPLGYLILRDIRPRGIPMTLGQHIRLELALPPLAVLTLLDDWVWHGECVINLKNHWALGRYS